MPQYNPGSIPELRNDVKIWADQLTRQIRQEIAVIAKHLNKISSTTAQDTTVSISSGTTTATITTPDTHDILSATHTDSVYSSISVGDMLHVDSSNKWTRLPIGEKGEVLTNDGTDIYWSETGHSRQFLLMGA